MDVPVLGPLESLFLAIYVIYLPAALWVTAPVLVGLALGKAFPKILIAGGRLVGPSITLYYVIIPVFAVVFLAPEVFSVFGGSLAFEDFSPFKIFCLVLVMALGVALGLGNASRLNLRWFNRSSARTAAVTPKSDRTGLSRDEKKFW